MKWVSDMSITSICCCTAVRKTMMGVSKGTKSSDSWRKAYVRGVREIDVTVNWSFSMLVVREGGFICWVGVKIRVRVKGVKRIPIGARRDHYAIDEIFTSANMTMMELNK